MPVTIARLTPVAFALLELLAPHAAAAQSTDGAAGSSRRRCRNRRSSRRRGSLRRAHPARAAVAPARQRLAAKRRIAAAAPAAARPADEGRDIPARRPHRRLVGKIHRSLRARSSCARRRETVLADWLRYDFLTDEIWGKGDVLIRYGFDWITGPEVKFKRGTETGFFASPQVLRRGERLARQRGGDQVRGPRSLRSYRRALHDVRRAARGLVPPTWASSRSTRRGWWAPATTRRCISSARPVIYSPWFEFPLSNERKSGFLTPTTGLTGIRGFEYAQPYYLNLAPQLRRDDHARAS